MKYALILGLFVFLFIASAFAISDCVNLSVLNGIYTLTGDVYSNGTCFNITNTNVTLDCDGYTIIGNGSDYGVSVNGYNRMNLQDCTIINFSDGIFLNNSNLSNIDWSIVEFNANNGIYVMASNSLVIDNVNSNSNGNHGMSMNHEYNLVIYNSNMTSNVQDGLYLHEATYGDFRYNRMEWNNNGLNMLIGSNNYFINNTFNNNDNNGFNSMTESIDNIQYCNFSLNGWTGIDIEGGSAGNENIIDQSYIYGNNYDGIYVNGKSTISNSQILSNVKYGIESMTADVIYGNIISDNHDSGIKFGNTITYVYSNHIIDNWVYGIYKSESDGVIYDNYFNNSYNFYWKPGLSDCDPAPTMKTALALGTNIIGGPYLGGNAWYNTSGEGKGYSDNATRCAGNSSGICTNAYSFSNTCTYSGNPRTATDSYPLAGTAGSSQFINVVMIAPSNDSVFYTNNVSINYTLNMTLANATCLYYLDGQVSNFTIIGVMLNNTSLSLPIIFTDGNHSFHLGCSYGTINGWGIISNISINRYVDIFNFTSPADDTEYTMQPYVVFSVNSSFPSVLCLGYLNGNNIYTWPPFIVNNGSTYIKQFSEIQNLTTGAYDIDINCSNSSISDQESHTNFTVNASYYYTMGLTTVINSPSYGSAIYNADGNISVNATYWSNAFTYALCDAVLDNNMPIGVYNVSANVSHLFNLTGVSNGTHAVSAYCISSGFYSQSSKNEIYMNPLGVLISSPVNMSPVCGKNTTVISISFDGGGNYSSALCDYILENETILDAWARNTNVSVQRGEIKNITTIALPTGLHYVKAYCVNYTNMSDIYVGLDLRATFFDIQPKCIEISSPANNTIICNQTSILSMLYNTQVIPVFMSDARCGIAVDGENIDLLIAQNEASLPVGEGFIPVVPHEEWSNLVLQSALPIGVHTFRVFCYGQSLNWHIESDPITLTLSNNKCGSQAGGDVLDIFFTQSMLMFFLSVIVIGAGAYIGYRLGGSLGSIVIMTALVIVLSFILDPPFIPLWVGVIALIAGILAGLYIIRGNAQG